MQSNGVAEAQRAVLNSTNSWQYTAGMNFLKKITLYITIHSSFLLVNSKCMNSQDKTFILETDVVPWN